MEQIIPINNEPVSPINIFAGVRLNFKNAINDPTNANDIILNTTWSAK